MVSGERNGKAWMMSVRRDPTDEWVRFERLVEMGETNEPPAKIVRIETRRDGRLLKRLFKKMGSNVTLTRAYFVVPVCEGKVTRAVYELFVEWLREE